QGMVLCASIGGFRSAALAPCSGASALPLQCSTSNRDGNVSTRHRSAALPCRAPPGIPGVRMQAYRQLDFLNLDDQLSDEEKMVRDTVRAWVSERFLPGVMSHFEAGTFPMELV